MSLDNPFKKPKKNSQLVKAKKIKGKTADQITVDLIKDTTKATEQVAKQLQNLKQVSNSSLIPEDLAKSLIKAYSMPVYKAQPKLPGNLVGSEAMIELDGDTIMVGTVTHATINLDTISMEVKGPDGVTATATASIHDYKVGKLPQATSLSKDYSSTLTGMMTGNYTMWDNALGPSHAKPKEEVPPADLSQIAADLAKLPLPQEQVELKPYPAFGVGAKGSTKSSFLKGMQVFEDSFNAALKSPLPNPSPEAALKDAFAKFGKEVAHGLSTGQYKMPDNESMLGLKLVYPSSLLEIGPDDPFKSITVKTVKIQLEVTK